MEERAAEKRLVERLRAQQQERLNARVSQLISAQVEDVRAAELAKKRLHDEPPRGGGALGADGGGDGGGGAGGVGGGDRAGAAASARGANLERDLEIELRRERERRVGAERVAIAASEAANAAQRMLLESTDGVSLGGAEPQRAELAAVQRPNGGADRRARLPSRRGGRSVNVGAVANSRNTCHVATGTHLQGA